MINESTIDIEGCRTCGSSAVFEMTEDKGDHFITYHWCMEHIPSEDSMEREFEEAPHVSTSTTDRIRLKAKCIN